MKKTIIVITLLLSLFSYCQIGIGTPSPAPSAQLDVTSTTRSLVPPRMTNQQKLGILSPVAGLMLWCTDCGSSGEMQVYNGSYWTFMGGPSSGVPGAPSSVSGIAGNGTATISFSPPVSDGGSPIMGYSVIYQPGGFTFTPNPPQTYSPITVTGLTNGTTYIFTVVANNSRGNSAASVASVVTPCTVPDPPTIVSVIGGNASATVNFTAPLYNGGSTITSYTVTSSPPGGFSSPSLSSPITVTELTNGTAYTFTVVATNAAGNSLPSASSYQIRTCGAYVSATLWKQFLCHNLGADSSFDPNTPVRQINGDYYQWGRNSPAGIVNTTQDQIVGTWGSQGVSSANGNWTGTGGPNNPCPTGFRVPSSDEWNGVKVYNTRYSLGTWTNSSNNFGTVIYYGLSASIKTLTLPVSGYRNYTDGTLTRRGNHGPYWSSTESSTNSLYMAFDNSNISIIGANYRTYGFSVRCIAVDNPSTNGTAVFSYYTCNTASAGIMKTGVAVSGVTQTITVDVTTPGTYDITAKANGVTFYASGTFTNTGTQNVLLTATGTPVALGTNTFTLNTTPNCSFDRYTSTTGCYAIVNGTNKDFACHNLGATTTSDPNTLVQAIHGNYYQWGRSTVVATAYTSSALINGWNTTSAANGAWSDESKTPTDPCPSGFRVPTQLQWDDVVNTSLNTVSRIGTFISSSTNFGSALQLGTATVKTLTLPAAGYRNSFDGALYSRGSYGMYWSSTVVGGTNAWHLLFYSSGASTNYSDRTSGYPVRCVSQ